MAKLSKIFETVNHKKIYEDHKKEYLAKKLVESYMLSEGISNKGQTTEEVYGKLISEAIKYETEKEAVRFLRDIESITLNEGFMDTVKGIGTKIKNFFTGTIDAVKNFFKGDKKIKAAFDKFHSEIKPAYEALKKLDGQTPALDNKEEVKQLNQSLEITTDYSYLFEGDVSPTEKNKEPETEGTETEGTETDDEDFNAKIGKIVNLLAGKKKLDSPKKTGSSQKRMRFFKITKSGVNVSLWVGESAENMNILLTYMGASGKVFFNLHDTIVTNQLEMAVVSDIIKAMFANKTFNPEESPTKVQQAGKKLLITTPSGKPVKVFPGKTIIMMVGGKAKMPWKIKKAKDPQEFASVFAKVEGDESHSGVDVSENKYEKNPKTGEMELVRNEGETDEAYEARKAKDAHRDAKDDAGFEADDDGQDLEGEKKFLLKYFKVSDAELVEVDKVMKSASNMVNSGKIPPKGLANFYGHLVEYFDYMQESMDDEDFKTIKVPQINKKIGAIINGFDNQILSSIKPEDLPRAKAVVERSINKFSEVAKQYGVNVTYEEDKWDKFKGVEAIELKAGAADTEEIEGSDEDSTEIDAFGNPKKKEPELTDEQKNMVAQLSKIAKTYDIPEDNLDTPEAVMNAYDLNNTNLKLDMANTFERYLDSLKANETLEDSATEFNKLTPEKRVEAIIKIAGEFKNKEDAPVEEESIDSPEKWMKAVINNSGVKNVIDTELLEKMKVDSGSLWANFGKFAKDNNNDLAEVLISTKYGGDHKPMTDNEFLAYATGVDTIASYAQKGVADGKLDSQGYDKVKFNDFLVKATSAARTLNTVVNPSTLGVGASDGGSKKTEKPTETDETTPTGEETPAEIEQPKVDPYEAFLKQIEADAPELSTLMKESMKEDSMKVWSKEFVKLKNKGVEYDNIKEYFKTAPEFFNRKNLKVKTQYIADLSSNNIVLDIRLKALQAMKDEDVLDSFDSTAIFRELDGEPYKTGDFATTDEAKDEIFLRSKF
jgi:hypothetical protein